MRRLLSRLLIGAVTALKLFTMTAAAAEIEPTDDDLVAEVVARRGTPDGAAAPFGRLYTRHAPKIVAYIAARARPDAIDDLCQDVWARAWRGLPAYTPRGQFRGWLFEIARNALADSQRRRRPGALDGEEALIDERNAPPDQRLLDEERLLALRGCLDRLPARERAMVELRLSAASYDTICARLGLSAPGAHKLWHKVLGRLRDCFQRGRA
jgi:RNA polymerase sigma-70 factor (ECF subfamily)